MPPTLVQLSLDAAGIMLTTAAMSFLGLGAQDPTPEWGLMVSQGQGLLETNWWVAVPRGLTASVAARGKAPSSALRPVEPSTIAAPLASTATA